MEPKPEAPLKDPIEVVESLVKRISFQRPEDNQILWDWWEMLRELSADEIQPLPDIPVKFKSPVDQLQDILQTLGSGDEKLARKKLYRLTGKLDALSFSAVVAGTVFVLVMLFALFLKAFKS